MRKILVVVGALAGGAMATMALPRSSMAVDATSEKPTPGLETDAGSAVPIRCILPNSDGRCQTSSRAQVPVVAPGTVPLKSDPLVSPKADSFDSSQKQRIDGAQIASPAQSATPSPDASTGRVGSPASAGQRASRRIDSAQLPPAWLNPTLEPKTPDVVATTPPNPSSPVDRDDFLAERQYLPECDHEFHSRNWEYRQGPHHSRWEYSRYRAPYPPYYYYRYAR
jgi:hypothetical protein